MKDVGVAKTVCEVIPPWASCIEAYMEHQANQAQDRDGQLNEYVSFRKHPSGDIPFHISCKH